MFLHDHDVHGIAVRVTCDDRTLSAAVAELLGDFPTLPPSRRTDCRLELRASPRQRAARDLEIPRGARVFTEPFRRSRETPRPPLGFFTAAHRGGELIQRFEQVCIARFAEDGAAATQTFAQPVRVRNDQVVGLIETAIVELLRRHGLVAVHAAALEKDGRGVLVPGARGQGKTTTSLTLARGGFRILSDDLPLLRATRAGPEVLAFRGSVNVTPKTIGFFRELRSAPSAPSNDGKRRVRIAEIFPRGLATACRPRLVLFPRIVDSRDSALEPLPKARALEELLPHSMVVHDRERAPRHFDLLARVIEGADCYRLHFGADLARVPALVGAALGTS